MGFIYLIKFKMKFIFNLNFIILCIFKKVNLSIIKLISEPLICR